MVQRLLDDTDIHGRPTKPSPSTSNRSAQLGGGYALRAHALIRRGVRGSGGVWTISWGVSFSPSGGILDGVTASASSHVAERKPIPSHLWVAAGLATVTAWVGATFAGLSVMTEYSTAVSLLPPRDLATDRLGIPLSDFEYWWARYGGWLFWGVVALAIVIALACTWWFLRSRRPRACLAFAALAGVLSVTPFIMNASRIST